jgi:hypothetical protein
MQTIPRRWRLFPLLFILLMMACSTVPFAASPLSPRSTTTSLPTLPAPTRTSALPTASPSAPITGQTSPVHPQILPYPWDDRSPFKPDLIAATQPILAGLPGASIYHIDLAIAPSLTTLVGWEEVLYTNRGTVPLSQIYFRLFPNLLGGVLSISGVWVNDNFAQPTLSGQDSDLSVPLSAPLAPGGRVVLRLAFNDQIPPSYPNGYDTFVYAQDILSLAQFYPLIPAYDAAGWHTEIPPAYGDVTYADTAFYLVRITAPADLVIAATGVSIDRTQSGGNQTLTLAAGPVREFYIQASPGYSRSSTKIGETTLNTYTLSASQTVVSQTLDDTKAAFRSYENRFGAYPYTVFNISASPTQALGVEYPQEIALALGLYDQSTDTANRYLEGTLAHEVAHQWWYGIVGDDQVNQPWLDESMAQYSTYLYFEDTYGSAAAQTYLQDWLRRWAGAGSQPIPIGQPVSAYTEQEYSAIVYGRGPLFIEALAKQMGDAKFAAFLKDYYAAYRFGIATTADYERAAEKDCACDLHPLFQKWVTP